MQPEIIARLGAPVPRYTSYPTANHFSQRVGPHEQARWLAELEDGARLSLYVHIPFCRELCWYCACATKASRRDEPVRRYLEALEAEIAHVAARLPHRHGVAHVHWGGGSPSLLAPDAIRRLGDRLRRAFTITADAEIAVEIDPRDMTAEKADAFAEVGVTRASFGVQDFDGKVQAAINRVQSFAATRDAVAMFRTRGVASVNIDLVYGLPHQTVDSVARTFARVLEIGPDRIAVFGYAHLPQRAKQQRLIDEAALPGPMARYAQSQRLAQMASDAGYVGVGLDHFAKPDDALAGAETRRNFQGYTTDAADALIGLGASAISHFPAGYVQNAAAVHDYERRIADSGSASARGIVLTADDRMRAFAIERLMCDFAFPGRALRERFGAAAEPLLSEARDLVRRDADGLLAATADGFTLTGRGRPFVRTVCSWLDTHLAAATSRHALAV